MLTRHDKMIFEYTQVLNSTASVFMFRRARFCPAPPGDSLTRKSLFDSLLAGCIPVIFIRASLSQYSWFLSKEEVDAVSVYISMKEMLTDKVNFMERLSSISDDEILSKQSEIARIAPRLQYAVVMTKHNNTLTSLLFILMCSSVLKKGSFWSNLSCVNE